MTNAVTPPAKGQPVRASWAVALTDAVNRNTAELSSRPAAASSNRRREIGEPHPFMVVGGCTSPGSNGSEQFTIFLPDGCIVDGSSTIDAEGVTAVDDAPGRYAIDDPGTVGTSSGTASTLYLVVHTSTGTFPVTSAMFTTNLNSVPQRHTVNLALPVARIFKTTLNGDTWGCVAEQLVRSSVVLSSSSGGGNGGGAEDFKYSYKLSRSANKIYVYLRDKHLMVDGAYVDALNTNANNTHWVNQAIITSAGATDVYLNIAKETNGWSASFASAATQGAKWSICIGHVERQEYAGANPVLNYVVGALILNSGNTASGENEVDVLTDVAYSNSTHKLTKTKQKVKVLGAVGTETTEDVFTATDHANEHSNGL